MLARTLKILLFTCVVGLGSYILANAKGGKNVPLISMLQPPADSTQVDRSEYTRDRYGDEFSNPGSKSPLQLEEPSNVEQSVEIKDDLSGYTVEEKVGDLDYRPPSEMTFQEFAEWQRKRMINEYWEAKSNSDNPRAQDDLAPPLFEIKRGGKPIVEIRPSGFVSIELGGRWQRVDNPAVPIRQQRTGGFDFDQQISLNMDGTIGERLKVKMNWDTKATFDFDNNIKVSYEGKERDIVQEVQAGNVSMPLNNSLIRGAQNLFGIKTKLRFGRLWVTALVSNQRGKTDTEVFKAGAKTQTFEIQSSEYDVNRHFFLSQFFRSRFNQAYQNNPTAPNTGFKINRVEVYVTNTSSRTEGLRDFVGFTDLGENGPSAGELGEFIYNDQLVQPNASLFQPDNDANSLLNTVTQSDQYRNSNTAVSYLRGLGFELGTDFERVTSARKLNENEFTFHPDLGYVSLNFKLKDDEALAVSYEYTLNGRRYQVGELTEDYQELDEKSSIVLKLIKPQSLDINLPTWDLMMKNVYRISATGIEQESFRLKIIYRDDRTGIDNPSLQEGNNIKDVPLVQLLDMDKLNLNGDLVPDGNFDYIENATVNSRNGVIVFPVLQPFGDDLEDEFRERDPANVNALSSKYAYNDLYTNTQNQARQKTSRNKFFLNGQFESSVYGDIRLRAFDVDENSVSISVGSIVLQPGTDFTVNNGMVKILNEGALASGNDIIVKYESPEYFSFRQKSLLGTRLDYEVNEDFTIGGTVMHLSERPLLTRVNAGDEPIKNTQVGLDVNFKDDSRILTKAVDKLPIIQTKEESNVAINWEGAMLKPGASKLINTDGGTAYLDDFEGSANFIDFTSQTTLWNISSAPRRLGDAITDYQDWESDSLDHLYHRGKLSYYRIDRTFYTSGAGDGISLSEIEKTNNYTRAVIPQEIFKNQNYQQGQTNQEIFDLAYYPAERGPYNYNTNNLDLGSDGRFLRPENNWAGITRAIKTGTDFDNANIEYIEFWLMDPFHDGGDELAEVMPEYASELTANPDLGGEIFFNLGDISEDVIKDSRHAFENGLPENTDETIWGEVTTEQLLTESFDNQIDRGSQDKGLDGLNSAEEQQKFDRQINEIATAGFDQTSPYVQQFVNDPSTDDFTFYTTGSGDTRPVLERYKNFYGLENNSPVNSGSSFTPASQTVPDNEDMNGDKTLNINDRYFQYKVSVNPNMNADNNPYIIGEIDGEQGVKWYQFRIPVKENFTNVGGISGFQTIKFFRMYLTNFKVPVVLRMAQLRLVSSQWRKKSVREGDLDKISPNDGGSVAISTVNVEENSSGSATSSPYVLPPGVNRDYDQSSNISRLLNEQSLSICVDNLEGQYTKGGFKNIVNDLIAYKRLKMYVHAESAEIGAADGDLHAVIRLGTDIEENYYQIEFPLSYSNIASSDPNEVWPDDNLVDVAIEDLIGVKVERNRQKANTQSVFSQQNGKYTFSVRGNPDMRAVRTVFLGVKNPANSIKKRTACIWFNELRVTEFNKSTGYATTGSINTQLADLGTFSASGRYISPGYGDIESKIGDVARETTIQYGAATNLSMDKFIPGNTGIQLPLYLSYDKEEVRPEYDPLQPDVKLDQSLDAIPEGENPDEYRKKVIYDKTVKSINLTNVRKVKVDPEAKKHIYDVENLSLSAGYTLEERSGIGNESNSGNNLHSYRSEKYNGAANYQYSTQEKPIEPLKNAGAFKSKHLQIIRDINFNPLPNSFSMTNNFDRLYNKTQLYNADLTIDGVDPTYEKSFYWRRDYNFRWNITKSINLSYSANANTIIDEPNGDKGGTENATRPGYVNTRQEYKDSVWNNISEFGRMKNFDQSMNLAYQLPFDKIPTLNWVSSDASYRAGYTWQAGAFGLADSLGNTASNNREIALDGKLNFVRLYNKSKYLKSIDSPSRRRRRSNDDDEEKSGDGYKKFLKPFLMVRNITGRYNLSHSTTIPGFLPKARIMGVDTHEGNAPGWDFVAGDQDLESLKEDLVANEWYSRSSAQNQPLVQTRDERLDLKSLIEPFNDFRVNLTAKYSSSRNYSEIFVIEQDPTGDEFGVSNAPVVSGSLSMSYIAINTAFSDPNEVFQQFERNRSIIRSRRQFEGNQYNINSQEVLIPAFMAAYSGEDANSINLSNAPKIPLPNWRIDYSGLTKMKAVRKLFSSVSLSHGYVSTYDIVNYTSSLEYGPSSIDRMSDINEQGSLTDSASNTIPKFVINQVAITEKFAPLIGINIRTKSRMSYRFDYNRSRTMDLNMSNTQVTDVFSQDFVFGFGWSKKDLRLPIRREGARITLKNDVTFKLDITIRETQTVQRQLEGTQTVTAGNWNFQLKPNISYQVNNRVNIQIFFERTINEPKISSSFTRKTTAAGFRLRFNLS